MALGRTLRISILASAPTALFALIAACSTSLDQSASGSGGACVGLSCGPNDAGHDQVVSDGLVPDAGGDSAQPPQNPLCGMGCLPDDENACASTGGNGGSGGSGGASPSGGDAGVLDATVPDAAADAPAEVPDAGDAGPPTPPPAYGCGVVHGSHGSPASECIAAGDGESGAPCVSAWSCRAGLACVGEGNAALCRPYCCGDPDVCGKGTYCAERKQKDDTSSDALTVPVCIPADDCSLDEPYPCSGSNCTCKDGTACAVVKDDGTTSCVPPGTGRGGEACPCAAGYVCSKATSTCLKLCSTNSANADCGSGKCVSVAYLPTGYGVCGL